MRDWNDFPEQHARFYTLRGGLIYTARYATTVETERAPAVLLVSLTDKPIDVEAGDLYRSGRALLVSPKLKRKLHVWDAPFTGLHIDPSHPVFGTYRALLRDEAIQEIDPSIFKPVIDGLTRCYTGQSSNHQALDVFDRSVHSLNDYLGVTVEQDPRITTVLEWLMNTSPLDYTFGDVLDRANLSSGRLSHLFTEEVGISLRTFKTWRKVREALSLLRGDDNLTSVAHMSGFSDSAHFSRTFAKTFGLIPSMFASDRCVQVMGRDTA